MYKGEICPLCFNLGRTCDHSFNCIITDDKNVITNKIRTSMFKLLKDKTFIGCKVYYPFTGDITVLSIGETLSDDIIKQQYPTDIYNYYQIENILITGRKNGY